MQMSTTHSSFDQCCNSPWSPRWVPHDIISSFAPPRNKFWRRHCVDLVVSSRFHWNTCTSIHSGDMKVQNRLTDRQTDRQTERQTGTQTHAQTRITTCNYTRREPVCLVPPAAKIWRIMKAARLRPFNAYSAYREEFIYYRPSRHLYMFDRSYAPHDLAAR